MESWLESLLRVASGDENVAVGISGFGSARIGHERWKEMATLTGRTSFYLQYDAQTLPFEEEDFVVSELLPEMMRRWKLARQGSDVAASYLASWLRRWSSAGKKILVVGFSLGAYVAWEAIRQVDPDLRGNIQLVMISAAVADQVERWEGIEDLGVVVNLFSREDVALRYMYPHVVGSDETPAAGLGPLVVSPENLYNVDATDKIGRDHLWASFHLVELVRTAMGCVWGGPTVNYVFRGERGDLSGDAIGRLYAWTFVDPDLWSLLSDALDGSEEASSFFRALDGWSLEGERLPALLNAGSAVRSLMESSNLDLRAAVRSARFLKGMVRHWISESPDLEVEVLGL